MINPFNQWFDVSETGLRALSQIGITTHWLILQYSIGLFTIVVGFEILARLRNNENYLEISKSLSKVAIVIFAAGAATGSMGEFGLLLFWPGFLELVGKYFFAPFYLELFAFFAEVIFIYMYYYTWDRVGPRFHILLGILGVLGLYSSALLIMTANTLMGFPPGIQATYNPANGQWSEPSFLMTTPDGVQLSFTSSEMHTLMLNEPGYFNQLLGSTVKAEGIFGIVFTNPGVLPSFLHAVLAAILVSIFTVIGVYAYRYRNQPESKRPYYRDGLRMLSFFAIANFVLQGVVGHSLAQTVSEYNPEKLAAFEATSSKIISLTNIPYVGEYIHKFVAFLAFGGFDENLPNYDAIDGYYQVPLIIHYIYYMKIFLIAGLFANVSIFSLFYIKRRTNPPDWFIKLNYASPVFINLITLAGWFTREVGRKPWTIYGIVRVEDAARQTPVPPLLIWGVFLYCLILLGGLSFIVWYLFKMEGAPEAGDEEKTEKDMDMEKIEIEPQESDEEIIMEEGMN